MSNFCTPGADEKPLNDDLRNKISSVVNEYTTDNKISKEKMYQILAEVYNEWETNSIKK